MTFSHRSLGLASLFAGAGLLSGCSDEGEAPAAAFEAAYVIAANVVTPDGDTTLVQPVPELPSSKLDLSEAYEISGYGDLGSYRGRLYMSSSEDTSITSYSVEDGVLRPGAAVSLKNRGISYLGKSHFLSQQRAFTMNGEEFSVIEWNPSTMTITKDYDISGMRREGWGHEERGAFLREADGKLFFYWAYTNDRLEFINDFVIGVLDTTTGQLEILEDTSCPASAGFGGFFDENHDLYLVADSFGAYTLIGDIPDKKQGCVLRIRAGEASFDPTYRFVPPEALGGLEPWGFYYAGGGVAYTTAIDPAKASDYESGFEFIFAPIHTGWMLDIYAQTARELEDLPLDGVGFSSYKVGERLLIPRSTGSVKLFDIDNVDTTVYALDGASGTTEPLFTMPGYLVGVESVQ